MKRPCCLFVASLVLALTLGQTALAQDGESQPAKYWIFLQDKRDAAGKATVPETNYLTERARQRRLRRGTATPSSFDAPLSPAYLDALRQRGVTPLMQSRWLNAVSARLDARQVATVRTLSFVREVRPVAPLFVPPEPKAAAQASLAPVARKNTRLDYGSSQQQLEVINAIPALERGINGTGVRIGFLDTEFGGFQHASLVHVVNQGRLLGLENFAAEPNGSLHGRSVASVAVGFDEGDLIGPGYGAEVLAATTEFEPTETNQEEDNFVAGLEWMEALGVDVVNTSLGYSEFDAGQHSYTPADLDGDTGITTRAADRAAALGVVVVTSAGNEGNAAWRFITMPADGDSVIAVGGVTSEGVKAGFSGVGPTADGRIKPDVSALGVGVTIASGSAYSTNGSGTSYASPIVAGVVAQILQVNPDLNPIEVRDLLRETASQPTSPNNSIGWGVIDADAAVQRAEQLATDVADTTPLPDAFTVMPPYPNPFTEKTTFEVHTPERAGFVQLRVYNLLGRLVAVPFEGPLHPGLHRLVFNAASLPAGLYLYRLESDHAVHSGKMVVVR